MSRAVYVLRNGRLVEKHLATPSPKAGHFIISDTIPATWNPATGKQYDSRSTYYRETKAAGCEVVGSDNGHRTVPKAKVAEPLHVTVERLNQQKGWGL